MSDSGRTASGVFPSLYVQCVVLFLSDVFWNMSTSLGLSMNVSWKAPTAAFLNQHGQKYTSSNDHIGYFSKLYS